MAWLILAIVVAFAVDRFAPIGRRASGSAFSSFTSEVSLVPNRAPAAERLPSPEAAPANDHPVDQLLSSARALRLAFAGGREGRPSTARVGGAAPLPDAEG